ncbi:MAG: hypothetical protein IKM45_04160 [Opitutales bacterium]|nr:hypothetical protein [Opitutales bacterium]
MDNNEEKKLLADISEIKETLRLVFDSAKKQEAFTKKNWRWCWIISASTATFFALVYAFFMGMVAAN